MKWCMILIVPLLLISSGSIASNIQKQQSTTNSSVSSSSQPSPNNVYNEIDIISDWYRYLDTPGHRNAENYIFSKFESYGLNTSLQEYTCHRLDGDVRGVNILGFLESDFYVNKLLIIAGHYDATQYSTHGAYDNAAGAASVIELARFFTEYFKNNAGPTISILFATWDAEEGGGAGSKYFLDNLPTDMEIVANINLDMYCLNYPVRNSIPGSTEDYFKLNLYTGPVNDFSGYSNIDFNESTIEKFEIFQRLLSNITNIKNNYPPEWVIVMDDTKTVSDHSHFIRESIPAVWFRGMNEYPKDEGDLNERNFKHTPVDTLETMERYAGGKTELLKGINTGLTISYQFALEIIDLYNATGIESDDSQDTDSGGIISDINSIGWLIAVCIILIIFASLYYFSQRLKKQR